MDVLDRMIIPVFGIKPHFCKLLFELGFIKLKFVVLGIFRLL